MSKLLSIVILILVFVLGCKKTDQDVLTYAAFFDLRETETEAIIQSFRGDNAKNVVIASTYHGKPITGIDANVFNYKQLLKDRLNIKKQDSINENNQLVKDDSGRIIKKVFPTIINQYLLTTLMMERIDLPETIKSIGMAAFAMPSLQLVRSFNPIPPILGANVFATNQLLTIYVPAESLEAYQEQWTTTKIGTDNVEWKTF